MSYNASFNGFAEPGKIYFWDFHIEEQKLRVDHDFATDLNLPAAEASSLLSWRKMIHQQDLLQLNEQIRKFGKGERTEVALQVRLKNSDQGLDWVAINSKCKKDEHGRPYMLRGTLQFINEWKSAEAQLLPYRQLLQTTEAARIGSWEVDVLARKLVLSNITKSIYGLEPDFIPDIDTAINFVFDEDGRAKIRLLFHGAFQAGQSFDTELQLRRKSGDTFWVRVIGVPEEINGKYFRVHGLMQDITRQVYSKHRLYQQEALFTKVFEHSVNGMAFANLDGSWIAINQSFCNFLGYSKEELDGEKWRVLTHPEDLKKNLRLTTELLEGKSDQYTMEKRYIHKNGSIIWAILAVAIIKDEKGNALHFVSQITDITERKNLELTVKDNTLWLDAFFKNTSSGHLIFDIDYKIKFFNKNLAKMAGVAQGKKIAKEGDARLLASRSFRKEFLLASEKAFNGEAVVLKKNITYPHMGGTIHWHLSFIPLADDKGRIIGVSYIANDITISNNKEARLIKQENALKNLAFMQSHEIRRPVASILGLLDILKMEEYGKDNEAFDLLQVAALELDQKIRESASMIDYSIH